MEREDKKQLKENGIREIQADSEAGFQQKQLDQMSIEQLASRIQQNQDELETFQGELINRAQVQEYTEQYSNDVLSLLKEALELIWQVPDWMLSPEWETKRDQFVTRVTQKVEDDQWPKK